MKTAKWLGMILAVVLVLSMALVACGTEEPTTPAEPTEPTTPTTPAEPIILKLVAHSPASDVATWAQINDFIDLVQARSNGALTFDFLGGPEIHPGPTLDQFTRDGMTDAMYSIPFYYAGSCPELQVAPFLKPEYQVSWFMENDDLYNLLDETVQDGLGLKWMGQLQMAAGPCIWTTDAQPITGADWSGVKLRVDGPLTAELAQHMGASPVNVKYPEIPQALERGTIDGTTVPITAFYDSKLYEFCSHLLNIEIYSSGPNMWLNLDTWNNLPANLQETLMDTVKEYQVINANQMEASNASQLQEMTEKYGIQVHEITSEDLVKLNAAQKKVWDEFLKPTISHAEELESLMAGHFIWD